MKFYLLAAAAAGGVLWMLLRKNNRTGFPLFGILTFVLPFAVGGFHGYTAAAASIAAATALHLRYRERKTLAISPDMTTAALGTTVLCLILSPLWAVDRGMALFGLLQWLPILLYWVYLDQCDGELRDRALSLVPHAGAVMVAVSLMLLPFFPRQLTVNGRLAGFFQYPNTFAAFLLAGYILCAAGKQRQRLPMLILLAGGVILSGSRTAFLLLMVGAICLGMIQKNRQDTAMLVLSMVMGVLLGYGAEKLGLLSQAQRYQDLADGGTFFARLLYWQDALPVIGKHPLGIGYLGWRSLQGSVQTGRYFTSYVHNGLLQLLLDAGWIPAALMATALLKGLLAKGMPTEKRLLLILLLAYAMVDFHTEYPVIWVILFGLMPPPQGKRILVMKKKAVTAALAVIGAVCLWLGTGQALYYSGNVDACLAITPFHTDAMEAKLAWSEPEQLLPLADRLLSLDDHRSRGWNTKAWAARDNGDWETMIAMKEKAIACDRYNENQYLDYVNCLYAAMQTCLQRGEEAAAWTLAEAILTVPPMMEERNEAISSLAVATGDDNLLSLPEEYKPFFAQLEALVKERE